MRLPRTISRLLYAAMSAMLSILAVGCNAIFEGTEDCCEPKCEVFLQLHFDVEEPLYDRVLMSRGSTTAADLESFVDIEAENWRNVDANGNDINHRSDVKRYIIRAFPLDDAGNYSPYNFEYFIIDASTYGFSDYVLQKIILGYKRYRIYVWADYGDSLQDDLYYDTTDFGAITFHGDYSGSNYNRVAYVGSTDIDLTLDALATRSASTGSSSGVDSKVYAYVAMSSPLARFLFITTDLESFKEEMESRYRSRNSDTPHTAATFNFNTSNYLLRIRYPGYLPSVYSIFSNRPTDAAVGVSFYSSIVAYGTQTALLGFDYIFVNGDISAVDVVIDVFELDDDGGVGDYLGSTSQMSIPIESGHFTAVYGEFLTTTGSGSVGIDPAYDNEVYIHWQ